MRRPKKNTGYLARIVTVARFTSFVVESEILSLWTRYGTRHCRTVWIDAERFWNTFEASTPSHTHAHSLTHIAKS